VSILPESLRIILVNTIKATREGFDGKPEKKQKRAGK
jgi:hypothetical protein